MGRLRFIPVIALALSLPCSLPGATVQKTKQFGETRSDKALVYAIREKAFAGSAAGVFVFADQQLIAFLRNGTYSFAYIDPGQHMIWGDIDSTLDAHLVAGETYYVSMHFGGEFTLLSEGDGKAAIDRIGAYIQNDEKDTENGAKRAAKRYDKALKREANKEKPAVEELPATSAVPTEGAMKVAANTKLSLELMENLSSALNTAGQTVWLRVAENVASDGKVVIPRGTPARATLVQVQPGGVNGAAGAFRATVVSVDVDAKHRVPIFGDVSSSGGQRMAGEVTRGGLLGLFIKGTEAFEAAGTRYAAWIRDETWLPPATATPATPSHSTTVTPAVELSFGANTRNELPPVQLRFPCSAEAPAVQLVSVDDWSLPEPVKATTTKDGETCTAEFDGWGLLRYLHPGTERQMLHLSAQRGGNEVHVDVPVTVKVN